MSQNPPKILEKCAKNHRKSRFRGVRGALGRGLGAMVAPRGAQEPKNIQKPRSRSTLGPPCGSPFSALFAIVRCFLWIFFQTFLLWIFYRFQTSPDLKKWFCLSKTFFFQKNAEVAPGAILVSIWLHFGRPWGTKIGKNAFQNRPLKKGRQKVTQGCARRLGPGRGGVPYNEGLRPGFRHYGHSPRALRGTVADIYIYIYIYIFFF